MRLRIAFSLLYKKDGPNFFKERAKNIKEGVYTIFTNGWRALLFNLAECKFPFGVGTILTWRMMKIRLADKVFNLAFDFLFWHGQNSNLALDEFYYGVWLIYYIL